MSAELVRAAAARALLALVLAIFAAAPHVARAQDDGAELGDADEGDEGAAESEADADEGAPAQDEDGAAQDEEPAADAQASEDDSAVAESEADPAEPEDAAASEAEPGVADASEMPIERRAISLHVAAGLGIGSLGFTRPTERGPQRLPESPFAASELQLRVRAWPAETLSLETQLSFQTSVGYAVELPLLFALPERVPARTQRVELSVGPRLAFSSSRTAVALALPIGFSLRSFFPAAHQYSIESHELGGVLARPELIVPLGELITLRAGGEAQWLGLISGTLERQGACCSGYAYGVQASLQARVGSTFDVALAYRELHSVIPAAARFEDRERFLTARFGGGL